MKLSPQWLRDFVDLRVDNHQLADDLTLAGIAVESVSGESDATVFEMEITTNRPDAMNHYGVAREASALYDLQLKQLESNLPPAQGTAGFAVEIANPGECARYTARIIRGVAIKPSPEAIAKRLISVDQRPINNIADASNYTLWEMGHPTHAFDLDLLAGGKILVRRAFSGEILKTLDGVERKLSPEDLVIADAVKPVALAGVMGGFDTMITGNTKNVLIESAWFDPVIVRKSSRRHGLHTDASHRFERGADFGATSLACARVTRKILESAGGHLEGGEIDVVARHLDQAPVALRLSEVQRMLGDSLGANEILRILRRLGFELLPEPGEHIEFTVQIPTWRLDIEREIDLIEEIARLHGYDKFPNTLPAFAGSVVELPDAKKDEKLRETLLAIGYNEAISLTFISHSDAEQFSSTPVLELENPLSEEASVMRSSMVPGMLNMLGYNLNRGNETVRLFERGKVFGNAGGTANEIRMVCFAATGDVVPASPNQTRRKYSFFDLKGDIETLLHSFSHSTMCFDAHAADYYHQGRSARAVMDAGTVAQFGQISPEIAAARKLRQDVFVAEVYLERLYRHWLRQPRYQPLPRYPAVQRDFSFILDDAVVFAKIEKTISALGLPELREFVPVEIFRGGSIPTKKYSLLLRATFQSNERTLREDEVAAWSAEIIKALERLGGTLRSQ
jgi:phenylalanyl-tRNA synthetase beta chain